ncbi:MAG: MauE/DoxX family redox-associated membrane protein [Chthoniobacterales bacterium]
MKQTSNIQDRTFAVRRLPWLIWRFLAFLIAAVFIYAGVVKILDPVQFARDIDNYKMLNWPVAVALGFYLPWLEILCGLAVIFSRVYRGGLLILTALTSVFIGASVVAKSRGLDISCGCFGHISKDWSFGKHLAVDFMLLAGLLFLWWRSWAERVEPGSVGTQPLASVEPR